MTKTIFVAGYYGFGNTGDELILSTILAQFRQRYPEVRFYVTSGSGERSAPDADAILWSDVLAMSDAISRSDLVLVGGGGLFHDYFGFEPDNALSDGHWGISYYTAPLLLAKLHARPVMLYGVGVGPLFSGYGKEFTRAAADAADVIAVRDADSAAALAALGVDAGRIVVTADPVLLHQPDAAEGRHLRQQIAGDRPGPVIAVAARPWDFAVTGAYWEREMAHGLDLFLREHGGTVLFVPFQHLARSQENDWQVAERIRSYMTRAGQALAVPEDLTPQQKYALLGQCDLVVALRLHAALAGIQAGVPAVSVSYDPKVDHLIERLRLEEHTLAVTGLSGAGLRDAMVRALTAPERFRQAAARLAELRPLAEDNTRRAVELLEQGTPGAALTPPMARVILRSLHRQIEDLRWLTGERRTLTAQVEEQARAAAEHLRQIEQLQAQLEPLARTEAELAAVRAELGGIREQLDQTESALREERKTSTAALQAAQREAEAQAGGRKKAEDAFHSYRADKEGYIAVLTQALERAERRPWFAAMRALRAARAAVLGALAGLLPRSWRSFLAAFDQELLTLQPAARAQVFTPKPGGARTPVRVSLISTVFEESASIDGWLESIASQTRLPDELVIVDAGSRDDTVARIERFQQRAPFPVRVIVEAKANIARGRNVAIRVAAHPVIACTDAGCRVHALWLENIAAPFEQDPETEVVAGWTDSIAHNAFEKTVAELFVARRGSVDWQRYLPSSRTIAFTKQAFEAVGGYPDWLTMWAEDSYFATRLRNESKRWVVAPDAIVYWESRKTWREVVKQAYRYGFGDGEAGLHSPNYVTDARILWRAFVMLAVLAALIAATLVIPVLRPWGTVALLVLATLAFVQRVRMADRLFGGKPGAAFRDSLRKVGLLYAIFAVRLWGYVRGLRNRPAITARRYARLQGTAVIFSGVPIDDSGGGQRATQLALELLARDWRVLFLNQYPRYETVDLKLRITHPNLEVLPTPAFDAPRFLATLDRSKPAFAIAEFPHPAFLAPLANLRAAGVAVIYDLIDDWRSSLGGDWYSVATEQQYLESSDHLLASARSLAQRLEAMGARTVHYVPNAVNRRLFVSRSYDRPADMPAGEFTILYVGALWGHWFDWDLLLATAEAYPRAAVVVIGDYHGQSRRTLPNLHFLGLKAQRDLPPYLANADVALIPFQPSELTQAVSPLKVFEYLAMRLPVVSTPLKELESLPYVTLADGEAFVQAVGAVRSAAVDDQVIEEFLREHSWPARIDQITALLRRS